MHANIYLYHTYKYGVWVLNKMKFLRVWHQFSAELHQLCIDLYDIYVIRYAGLDPLAQICIINMTGAKADITGLCTEYMYTYTYMLHFNYDTVRY